MFAARLEFVFFTLTFSLSMFDSKVYLSLRCDQASALFFSRVVRTTDVLSVLDDNLASPNDNRPTRRVRSAG